MGGRAARAWPAVQEHHRPSLGIAAQFPVDAVAVAGVHEALRVGLDFWIHQAVSGAGAASAGARRVKIRSQTP